MIIPIQAVTLFGSTGVDITGDLLAQLFAGFGMAGHLRGFLGIAVFGEGSVLVTL
jgi:hypothetical protein